jgi:hypothetical protein
MTGGRTPDELIAEMQAMVDEIREDPDVPKFTATAPDGGGATPEATPAG